VRRPLAVLALPALVGVSTLLHWLAARRFHGLWILPDEGVYAQRALAFWRDGHLPAVHGDGSGYSILYPLVAGFPFATGSLASGLASVKLLQALLVSLAAVPVFVYGRRLMRPGWAFAAAALTLASPLLLYSGLLMTETLSYPLAAWALLQTAHAVATRRHRDQLLALVLIAAAVLTRTQAIALVPVFGLAVLVDLALGGDRRRLRRFAPVAAICVLGAAALVVRPGLVGSYSTALTGGYPVDRSIELSLEHLALVVLATGVLPAAALLLLVVESARGRLAEPGARALVSVTLAALVVLPLQVGTFAARFAPHLLERDLSALPPVLLLVLALWLDRGAPRPLVTVVSVAFGLAALLLLVPWNHLTGPGALPDSFSLALLRRASSSSDAVAIAVPIALLALLAVPRRARLVLPGLVLAALVAASITASNAITGLVRAQQVDVVGSPANWIDRAATGPVAYLYDGEGYWNVVWQERFWNRKIDQVLASAPHPVPGPMTQRVFTVPASGFLPTSDRWVVATDTHRFDGEAVAHLAQTALDVTGLTLWHLENRPRLSLIEYGIQPNGDMVAPAKLHVFGCDGGKLQLTLLPKATHELKVYVNGRIALDTPISGDAWHGFVPAPKHTPHGSCVFTIVPQSLLGSTVIEFLRP
jgi:dolichyl-phosphate-mannose-protein mannosyltransferase